MAILGEVHGSPTEHEEWNGAFSAIRRLRCDWSTRHADRAALLAFPGSAYPGKPGVYATSADTMPAPGEQKGSGVTASYDEAILTVNYKSPGFNAPQDGGDYGYPGLVFSEVIEPLTEFMRVDPTGLTWQSDGTALDPAEAPGRKEAGFSYVFTRYQWEPTAQEMADILSLVGLSNATDIVSLTLGTTFLAGCLLFDDPTIHREWKGDGTYTLTGTFCMSHKIKEADGSGGWNEFWRKGKVGGAGYDKIMRGPSDQLFLYPPTGDFTKIRL